MRLARAHRRHHQAWLDSGGISHPRSGPSAPSDILILVRKRFPFAEAMVAELKELGIPVAGADRIKLSDQIAMQDLMAVGDFILCPRTIWSLPPC